MNITKIKLENSSVPSYVSEVESLVDCLLVNPLYGYECNFDIQSKQSEIRLKLIEKYSLDEIVLFYTHKETYKQDYLNSLVDSSGSIYRNPYIRVVKAGAVLDVIEKSTQPVGPGVVKIDKEHYYNSKRPLSVAFDAEEIPEDVIEKNGRFYKIETYNTTSKSKDVNELRKTFKRLRNIINANTEHSENCLWVTLTYAANIKGKEGNEQLYSDFKRAMTRLRRYTKKEFNCSFEYISVIEPQGRGAWHSHLILIFPNKAPYIDNKIIADCWDQGFTKTTKMNSDVDNLGAYLTAYLCDIPLDDVDVFSEEEKIELSFLPCVNKQGKKYIKGGRLYLYPLGMKIYRTSRGIKQPEIEDIDREELDQLTKDLTPLNQSTYEYIFDNNKKQVIRYTHYNKNKN